MNLSDLQMDVLDKFLRNEMTNSDEVLWKDMMLNPKVQDEVRNMTHLQKIIQQEGRERLRDELKSWDENSEGLKSKSKPRMIIAWRWAAAATVLLIASFLIFKSIKSIKSEPRDLFTEFFEPFPNIVAPIQKGNEEESAYQIAFQQYELGNYEKAESAYEALPQNDPNILFYHALTMISNGQPDRATEKLESLASFPGHSYQDATEWYLALLDLKSGDVVIAFRKLKDISLHKDHPFQTKAINLMNQMGSL